VVVGLGRPLESYAEEPPETGRELRRKQRVAFDDAGIAVGGALSGIAAVEEGDGKAALGKMQRHRNADDTGAEHDRIGASHENSCEEGLEGWLRGSTRNCQTYRGKARRHHPEPSFQNLSGLFGHHLSPLGDPC